ncbi:unnamed protein product [Euphydryas editha]|uniref:Uncharacterized protein n=1 Tax=Euphydryas editha TaxID=104508 RepID=A0AAU9V3L4_EUPED|nr:unnamed protein product [Euphydryas editha]
MLHINKNDKEKYETIDPYIRQTLKDVGILDYRRFHETSEGELETQYRDYENSQYDVDKLRVKRQFDPQGQQDDVPVVYEKFLTPLYVITAIFAAMLIIGPFLVKKGPNRGIVQACIMLSAFCMWIFWFTIYFGQMNPLMGPRLENTTVAWIAYKFVSTSSFLTVSALNYCYNIFYLFQGNPFGNTTL